jgi:hypothetical protein
MELGTIPTSFKSLWKVGMVYLVVQIEMLPSGIFHCSKALSKGKVDRFLVLVPRKDPMPPTIKTNTGAATPPLSRFMLWQIVGIVGFLHILYYAPGNDPTPLVFLSNAVVFLVLYPVVYFYNRLTVPAFFKMLISPLYAALQVILLMTTYIWITYALYATNYTLDHVSVWEDFANYYPVLFLLFVVDYVFFFRHLFGISGHEHSFWSSAGILSDAVSGVVAGYGLGKILDTKWGMFFGGNPTRVLFWLIFIMVGVAAVVWFNQKTRKG